MRRHLMAIVRLLALVSALWRPEPAQAHASLLSVHPAADAVLAQAPGNMRLQFNEPVSPLSVKLVDAAGRFHDGLTFDARGEVVEVALPPGLPNGTQTVSWRVVSADGHPVGGVVAYSIGAAGTAAALADVSAGRAPILWVLRVLFYVGVFGGIGGAFFRAWIDPGPPGDVMGRRLFPVLVGGFLALVVSVGVQGLDLLDLGWPAVITIAPWESAMSTSYGVMATVAAASLIVAALSLNEPHKARVRLLALLGIGGAGVALASTGHAASAAPQWLMRSALLVHAVGVAYWAGALAPLLYLSRAAPDRLAGALARFSRGAVWTVAVLGLAGVGMAIVQVESPAALVSTAYGRLLCVKLVLVALLLGLGAINRQRLLPVVSTRSQAAHASLRTTLRAEIALMLLVGAVVAGWRFTPPPRTLAATAPPMIHMHGERMMAMATIEPRRVGRNDLRIDVLGPDYLPLQPKELSVTISPNDGSLEPRRIVALRTGEGKFRVEDLYIPAAGEWTLRVDALVTDFEEIGLSDVQTFGR